MTENSVTACQLCLNFIPRGSPFRNVGGARVFSNGLSCYQICDKILTSAHNLTCLKCSLHTRAQPHSLGHLSSEILFWNILSLFPKLYSPFSETCGETSPQCDSLWNPELKIIPSSLEDLMVHELSLPWMTREAAVYTPLSRITVSFGDPIFKWSLPRKELSTT